MRHLRHLSRPLLLSVIFAGVSRVAQANDLSREDVVDEQSVVIGAPLDHDPLVEEAAHSLGLALTPPEKSGEAKQCAFDADNENLINMLVNNVYTEKCVFLRELLSNSSDALFKYQAQRSTAGDLSSLASEKLGIRIYTDVPNRRLVIEDNGIGMSEEDTRSYLGTIGRSGTRQLVESAKQHADSSLIGSFGVGFYASYLVAKSVVVVSKKYDGSPAVIWESYPPHAYSVQKCEQCMGEAWHGTRIYLTLNEDSLEFLEQKVLRDLVHKYSKYINFPINLLVEKTEIEEVPMTEEEAQVADQKALVSKEQKQKLREERVKRQEQKMERMLEKMKKTTEKLENNGPDSELPELSMDDEEDKRDGLDGLDDSFSADAGEPKIANDDGDDKQDNNKEEEQAEKKPRTKKISKKVLQFEQVNITEPLWRKDPSKINRQEYIDFYRENFKRSDTPLAETHYKVEGGVNYRAMLFLPEQPMSNPMEMRPTHSKAQNIEFYMRNVFVGHAPADYLNDYLNSAVGIIDFGDSISLTISRETMQNTPAYGQIRRHVLNKLIALFKDLAEDTENPQRTTTFLKAYRAHIIFGVMHDHEHTNELAKLLRFESNRGNNVGLADYVARMSKDQTEIYYVSAKTVEDARRMPHTESALRDGKEVLYFTNPLDEYAIQSLRSFEDKQFFNIARSRRQSPGTEEKSDGPMQRLSDFLRTTLKDHVERVVISKQLIDTPCAVSATEFGMSAPMERIARAQAASSGGVDPMTQFYLMQKKVLELNPQSDLIKGLSAKLESGYPKEKLVSLANMLYNSALMASGYDLKDPNAYARGIMDMVAAQACSATLEEVRSHDTSVDEESHNEPMNDKSDASLDMNAFALAAEADAHVPIKDEVEHKTEDDAHDNDHVKSDVREEDRIQDSDLEDDKDEGEQTKAPTKSHSDESQSLDDEGL